MDNAPRYLIILIVVFLYGNFSLCADNVTDNNTNVSQDIEKINNQLVYIEKNIGSQTDSILYLSRQTLNNSLKINYKEGISSAYFLISSIYNIRSINDSAIYYLEKGINYITHPKMRADYYWNLADLCRITGNYSSSLEYSLKLKDLVEKEIDKRYTFRIYNLLGLSYQALMEFELAKENYLKSIVMALKENNRPYAGIIYANLGRLYFEQDSLELALRYFNKGVRIEEESGLLGNAGNSYTVLAKIFMKKNMLDTAEYCLNNATKLNKTSGNKNGLVHTLMTVSDFYYIKNDYSNAKIHLERTIKLAQQLNIKDILSEAYRLKALIAAKQNNYKEAYENLELFYDVYSNLYDVERINKAKALEQKLIQQEKESQIVALELKKQKTINLLFLIITGLIVIFAVILSYYFIKIKQFNKQLKQSKNKAEESDRLKSKFLQTISHEIRTPLNGIIGFSEMILSLDTIDRSELKKINEMVLKNSNDLISTIENLVDIAHLSTNQFNVKKSKFNLTPLLRNVITEIKHHIIYNNQSPIDLQYELNGDIEMYSDKGIILKIISHLLKNAVLYTEKGFVKLSCKVKAPFVLIEIQDTGIGIPPEKIDVIFSPFRQADNNTNIKVGGTGLGLSIVSELIKLLNGEIQVESEVDKGSIFYIKLPIH